jgi:indole-3-glycerol phosphate synthase
LSILDEIYAHKRVELQGIKRKLPSAELERLARTSPVPADFVSALRDESRPAPRLIAEVKHRSPSKGVLTVDFDPERLARTYAKNGAAGISVLTDQKYFGGSLEYLQRIADLALGVPLLRKDFIFESYQLLEARSTGASAILLIVAMLVQDELVDLISAAEELDLTPLVEVHTLAEVERALQAGAALVGINNRDLATFEVSLETTLRLQEYVPEDVCLVAESGISNVQDIAVLADAGVDAVLVGEALVSAPDVGEQVRMLSQAEKVHQSNG